jgi:hypothetical protein
MIQVAIWIIPESGFTVIDLDNLGDEDEWEG